MKRSLATRLLALFLSMLMTASLVGCGASSTTDTPPEDDPETDAIPSVTPENVDPQDSDTEHIQPDPVPLDDAQKNSIAMLNYLAVLSQEINDSKNSRMFLEEAYASLINNTNPERVNELTESHLSSLLDIIEKYRMIAVKRDRLQYIYEQNKAKAIHEAMPNPIGLLSATNSLDLKRLAASAIYMAVDSVNSYKSYNADIAQDFLQDGWALDDEEAANLHDSRKRAFMFMIEIVREEKLPGELALSEKAVEDFVSWKNAKNNAQKIQFLEAEQSTYEAFGNYWLELANCYYENGSYQDCLDSMSMYEHLQANIFRKDYYLAKTLPKAIVAVGEVYKGQKYVSMAEKYIKLLLANAESSEWALKYFAAEMYLDLYAKTKDSKYIDLAYDIALNNVNNLIAEQHRLNSEYLAEVQEVSIPEEATKSEKKQIKAYNKALKKARETELPPVYEPLVLNCELLFALAEQKDISPKAQKKIDRILHDDSPLFLSSTLEKQFSYGSISVPKNAQLEKDALSLPAKCVSEASVIKVTVTTNGKCTTYDDWVIYNVDREDDDIDSFTAEFTSEKFDEHQWDAKSTVKVDLFTGANMDNPAKSYTFKVNKFKDLPVLPDIVEFEQVK